jgi:hypothetical protein
MVALTLTAARNNAEWCDALCRTHGARTTLDGVAWTSRTRTPPSYPDAVTFVPEPDVPSLLARIDTARTIVDQQHAVVDPFLETLLDASGPRPRIAGITPSCRVQYRRVNVVVVEE